MSFDLIRVSVYVYTPGLEQSIFWIQVFIIGKDEQCMDCQSCIWAILIFNKAFEQTCPQTPYQK